MATIVTTATGKPAIRPNPLPEPGKEFLIYIGDSIMQMGRDELVLFCADGLDAARINRYESVDVLPPPLEAAIKRNEVNK